MRVFVTLFLIAVAWAGERAPGIDLYRQMAPAVVGITCQGTYDGQPGAFYGTGVVVSPDGLVLSNITVVPADASELQVIFTDGRIVPAELVATHAASEGALIRLLGAHADLVHMPLADSDAAVVGDPVYTWGNPHFTIQRDGGVSLSRGRITARGSIISRDDQSRYRGPVIETDAAVNPGSDGGPLTDAAGHLLGIQSLAFADRSWLGLAIPTQVLRAGLPELADRAMHAPAGATGGAWQRERRLRAAADTVAEAVVGVWVERTDDDLAAPTDRASGPVAAATPIPRDERARAERRVPPGVGSGILVSADGLVITAAINVVDRDSAGSSTAVDEIERIWVYTADGARHPAELAGVDRARDLAVIRLADPGPWPHLRIPPDDPDDLTVGTDVALLGRHMAPGGLSLALGRISALHRNRGHHVQISALMHYGTVGGPVIDADGRLLGMANWLTPATNWRQNCGVGFYLKASGLAAAVPALAAGDTLPPLRRPMLGVRIDSEAGGAGATVLEVLDDGAAAAAGLRDGDVILRWDDEPVEGFIDLVNRIEVAGIGASVDLQVLRGDRLLEVRLTIGSDADDDQDDSDNDNDDDDGSDDDEAAAGADDETED